MTVMQDSDSIALFVDSMKKAASCARQLAKMTKNKSWLAIAVQFEGFQSKGQAMYNRPAPNRQETLAIVDTMADKASKKSGESVN